MKLLSKLLVIFLLHLFTMEISQSSFSVFYSSFLTERGEEGRREPGGGKRGNLGEFLRERH